MLDADGLPRPEYDPVLRRWLLDCWTLPGRPIIFADQYRVLRQFVDDRLRPKKEVSIDSEKTV